MDATTPQAKMKAKLETLGLPFKEIQCYGSQIVVTSHSRGAAEKWASVLGRFAKIRGLIKSVDYAKENKGTCLLPTTVDVWRTFAAL